MTDAGFGIDGSATRDELVKRVALIETMIAEGRQSTARYGWMFVLWGLVYFAAVGWSALLPMRNLAWPVCIIAGIVISRIGRGRQTRLGASESVKSRNLGAVWNGMGLAVTLFAIAGVVSHHGTDPTYVAAILFLVGLAHGISALMLRWEMQGVAAAIWWGCGIAVFFFTQPTETLGLFLTAVFFGQILFGLYVMMLERRRPVAAAQQHA